MFILRTGPGALVFWAWSLAVGAAAVAVGWAAIRLWCGGTLGWLGYFPAPVAFVAVCLFAVVHNAAVLLLLAFLHSLRDLREKGCASSTPFFPKEAALRGLRGLFWGFFLGAGAALAIHWGAGEGLGLSPEQSRWAARVPAVPSGLLAGLLLGLLGRPSLRRA